MKAKCDKLIFVYALCDSDMSVRYIGITNRSPKTRLKGHMYSVMKGSSLHVHNWLRSINGLAKILLLETVSANGDWRSAEKKWIAYYKSLGAKLTNHTGGGEGVFGYTRSESTKQRDSEVRKRWYSENDHPLLGKNLPQEWCDNLSDAHKGKIPWISGRKHSPETLIKLSDSHKGKPSNFAGKKHSKESLEKMSKSHSKPWSEKRRAAYEASKGAKNVG